MSEENVEIVRRWLQSGLQSGLQAADEFWEVDGDYYPVRKFPEARPCHGRSEIVTLLAEIGSAWRDFTVAIKDAKAIGDDRVLVHGELQTEGRASGMSQEGEIFYCFWLRHGHCFRQEDHLTLKGALHALGLRGETLQAAGLSE